MMATTETFPAGCVSRFKAVRQIGSGGFGSVWLATQIELDRPVAIKVLHSHTLEDPVNAARFRNEARITAALAHPNVVRLIDHGVDDGVPWIAYEFIAGASLRERLSRGPIPWLEALQIGIQVGGALDAAHRSGVVHRDIKPDNILEDEGGTYKIADFGISRWIGANQVLTETGVIMGSPAYLSPHQIRGEPPAPESDLYALATTIFEMIVGVPPYEDDNVALVLQRQLMSPIPMASTSVAGVPPSLDLVLSKALAKSRADRYEDAGAFVAALQGVLDGEHEAASSPPPTLAHASSPTRSWTAPPGRSVTSTGNARRIAVTQRVSAVSGMPVAGPRRPRWWPGVSLVLVGIIGTLWALWEPRPRGAPLAPPSTRAPAPASFVETPAFPAHRQLLVTLTEAAPHGAIHEVADAGGRLVGSGRVIDSVDPSSGRRRILFEDLPASRDLLVQTRDSAGRLVGAPLSVRTPDILPVPYVQLLETDDQVLVDIRREVPGPLIVEQGSVGSTRITSREFIGADQFRTRSTFTHLGMDKEYWIRVSTPSGWGGVAALRFRTRGQDHRNELKAALALLNSAPELSAYPDLAATVARDERVDPVLAKVLERTTPSERDSYGRLVFAVREGRCQKAAQVLLSRLDEMPTPMLKSACLRAAACAGFGVGPQCVALLSSSKDLLVLSHILETSLFQRVPLDPTVIEEAILRTTDYIPWAADALILASPVRARKFFKQALSGTASRSSAAWSSAMHGLARLGDDQALADLLSAPGHAKPGDLAGYRRWIPQLTTWVGDETAQAALKSVPLDETLSPSRCLFVLARSPEILSSLRRRAAPPFPVQVQVESLVALQSFEDPTSLAVLRKALQSSEPLVSIAAAWTIGMRRISGLSADLTQRIRSGKDSHGVAAWALVQVDGVAAWPRVQAVVRAALDAPPGPDGEREAGEVRAGLSAWIIGALGRKELRASLSQLAGARRQGDFARACARDALGWLDGTGPRAVYFLVPGVTRVRTGTILDFGDSVTSDAAAAVNTRGPSLTVSNWTLSGFSRPWILQGGLRVRLTRSLAHLVPEMRGELIVCRVEDVSLANVREEVLAIGSQPFVRVSVHR